MGVIFFKVLILSGLRCRGLFFIMELRLKKTIPAVYWDSVNFSIVADFLKKYIKEAHSSSPSDLGRLLTDMTIKTGYIILHSGRLELIDKVSIEKLYDIIDEATK